MDTPTDEYEWGFFLAGHAVARCTLNRPFTRIDLSDGLVGAEWDDQDAEMAPQEILHRFVPCRLAGFAAVLMLTGKRARAEAVAADDVEWAEWALQIVPPGSTGRDPEIALEITIGIAVQTLLEQRQAVEAVAPALCAFAASAFLLSALITNTPQRPPVLQRPLRRRTSTCAHRHLHNNALPKPLRSHAAPRWFCITS